MSLLDYANPASLLPTLRRMERNRYLTLHGKGRGHACTARLTPLGRVAIGEGGIPVLGAIAAGRMQEAIAEADTFLESEHLIPHRPGDFFLRVTGESMIGDGILPNDLVLLRPGIQPENGDIAAVQSEVDHEATLKRVLFDIRGRKRGVTLRASNPDPIYKDRVISADLLKIAGVFRGLVRNAAPKRRR